MDLNIYKNIYKTYQERDFYKRYRITVVTIHNVRYSDDKYTIYLDEDSIEVKDNKGTYEIFDINIDIQYVFINKIN